MFHNYGKEFNRWEKARNVIILILIAGLAVRFILMPLTSSPPDIAVWAAINDGIYSGDTIYGVGHNCYPPIWGYVLSVIGALTNLAGMGSFGDVFVASYADHALTLYTGFLTNLIYTTIVKIPGVIFDILGSLGAYLLVKRITGDQKKAVMGFALFFLAPVVIMSSSVLNMFDSMMITLMIFSLLTFMDRKYLLTGILLALAVYTKVFALLMIPIMVAYMASDREISINERMKNILFAAIGFVAVTVIVYLPTILAGEFIDSIYFLTVRMDDYSGFVDSPGYNRIFFFFPMIIAVIVAMFVIMFIRKTEREKTFFWLTIVSISLMFSFPLISYTPTYGITLLPAILLLYSLKGKIALIPWGLTIAFPLHGICHYGGTLLYPMGAAGMIDLANFTVPVDGFIPGLVIGLMSTAGMALIIITLYYVMKKKKEVKSWKSMLTGLE